MRILIPIAFLFTGCTNWEVVESDYCCGGHIHHTNHTVYVVDHYHPHHRHSRRNRVDHVTSRDSVPSRPTPPPSRPLPPPSYSPPQNPPGETRRPGEKHDP